MDTQLQSPLIWLVLAYYAGILTVVFLVRVLRPQPYATPVMIQTEPAPRQNGCLFTLGVLLLLIIPSACALLALITTASNQ
jgi:hypothetical protein